MTWSRTLRSQGLLKQYIRVSRQREEAHPFSDLQLLCLKEEADLPGYLGLPWTGEDYPLRAMSHCEAEVLLHAAQLRDWELAVSSKVRVWGPAASRGISS